MLLRPRLFGGLVILALGAVVLAQPPGGPGGKGKGGFGGPGFGRGGFAGPGMPGTAGLLRIPEVRKELVTTEQQNKQLDDLLAELQEQMRGSFGIDFRELQDLGEEERQRRFDAMRKKSEQSTKQGDEKLAKLLDAKQRERLDQLRLQREGVASFNRPEIAKALSLTSQQRDKVRTSQEFGPPGFGRGPGPRPGQREQAEILAILTPEQKTKWNELKGKEFKFPEFMGGFGPGGPGGPMGQTRKVVKQFDKDGDGRLNQTERQAARESLKKDGRRGFGRGPGGPGGPGFGPSGPGFGRDNQDPPRPGPRVSPKDVSPAKGDLYEPTVLRTLFIDFEDKDWEAALADFYHTDVEVPATLTVDGKRYDNVGVHFRGMSSYMGVPAGRKRSMNLALHFVNEKQRLYGYKTLNLLNAHDDPSMMSTVLYSHISRKHIPAPKANFVKLVINGESWGVYANVQQFNKEFMAENFGSSKGARWKVRGSPGGQGGLEYLGDDIEDYKRRYEIKSADDSKDWKAFIALCKTLNKTPPEKLEEALKQMLDLDGALWFLALDVALINNDGYWVRASDYSVCRDSNGKFHLVPGDMNEAFQGAMGFGPGGPGGPGGPFGPGGRGPGGRGGADGPPRRPDEPPRRPDGDKRRPDGEARRPDGPPRRPDGFTPASRFGLDPLVGLNNARTPLRTKLLAVPALRAKYLEYVRTIAEESLGWKNLGPVVGRLKALIEKEVEADTRKLEPYTAFQRAVADLPPAPGADRGGERGRRQGTSLRTFADERRAYLLNHAEIKKLAARADTPGAQEEKKP